jgi:hypothetical protein
VTQRIAAQHCAVLHCAVLHIARTSLRLVDAVRAVCCSGSQKAAKRQFDVVHEGLGVVRTTTAAEITTGSGNT